MYNFKQMLFDSALEPDGEFLPSTEFSSWFSERQQAHQFVIEKIPFSQMDKWSFDSESGNIVHDSGQFFSIEGIRASIVSENAKAEYIHPVINQAEIGFLGILTKVVNGKLYFLMQAKMEPGNINMIQLSPTLQATRSNFTQVHKGRAPHYLEYFQDRLRCTVLFDSLQSEQGARFFRKRNRNIVLLVDEDIDVPVLPDYCWLTLGQIHSVISRDNIVNMDARSVIACMQMSAISSPVLKGAGFQSVLARSLDIDEGDSLHTDTEILSWFAERKFNCFVSAEMRPLRGLSGWCYGDSEIYHHDGKYFKVGACRIEAGSREVIAWTQPVMLPCEEGLFAFICKQIDGVLHFLIQAKNEPGIFDKIEMGPTIHCNMAGWSNAAERVNVPFLDYVLNASPQQIRFDAKESEEGGRFYREENRNLIVEADDLFSVEVPDEFIWMTLRQLKEFVRYNNFVNVEARSLMSCLVFGEINKPEES